MQRPRNQNPKTKERKPVTMKLFFSAQQIATALSRPEKPYCKRTIQRLAEREGWPMMRVKNGIAFAPPRPIALTCKDRFEPLHEPDHQRLRTELRRAAAVLAILDNLGGNARVSLQTAIQLVRLQFKEENFSETSLLRWFKAAERHGIAALEDHRPGRSGRRPATVSKS